VQIRQRYGLFTAARPLDLPVRGQGGGIRFVPVCGESYAYGVMCYEPGEHPIKPLDSDAAEVQSGVFAVFATLNCGAVGYTATEYRAKVRNILEGSEQAAVEAALFSGLDFQGTTLNTLSLNTEAVDIPTDYDPGSIADVIGALERYAYGTHQYTGVAYIHAPVEVAAAAAAQAGLIIQDGPRKTTPLGSVWVFGNYPAGQIVITGQTTVWRAPDIQIYDSFDTVTNEMTLVAERPYAAAFECFAGRADFALPDIPGPTVPVELTVLTGADQVVSAYPVFYQGFTLVETSGTAGALVRIYDNASAPSGTILGLVSLSPFGSDREYYYPGLMAQHGIYVDVVSGAISGSVRTG
jgi:hypothetical protein